MLSRLLRRISRWAAGRPLEPVWTPQVSAPPPPPPAEAPEAEAVAPLAPSAVRALAAPPPPPPPAAPNGDPTSGPRNPHIRLMLADGTVAEAAGDPELMERIAYLADNLFPENEPSPPAD